ncbi:MAG: OmpA family protein, partial [Acetobacteraceae bacterium]|nr:OmpA family protein [Acetobacteraceae bacterium]
MRSVGRIAALSGCIALGVSYEELGVTSFKATFLAAAALALPLALQAPAARAQPTTTNWTGLYIGANVGGAGWGHTPYAYTGADSDHNLRGIIGGGTVGYNHHLTDNFVLGLETDLDAAGIKGQAPCQNPFVTCRTRVNSLGSVRARAGYAMGDILLYGTGGLGFGEVNAEAIAVIGTLGGQRKNHLGWSAGAGIEYAMDPNWSVKAEYIHYDLGSETHVVLGTNVKSRPRLETIKVGVNFRFGGQAAPVAVAPPVAAPAGKSFLVFFDWDKSTLTDRARGILREAAQTSKTTQHTRVEVNGYADTSGTPKYNQGISMRRAQTVAAELVRNGVAKGEIAIKA